MNSKMLSTISARHKQSGVVMVIALIALLLLSLIGTTSIKSSTIQERISGNLRDQDLAFQAAEAALHDAEDFLRSITTLAAFNNVAGLYTTDNAPDVYTAWPADARAYAGGTFGALKEVSDMPQYIIEIRGTVDESANAALNLTGGYGVSSGAGDIFIFKIHARGTGASGTSQVVLRTNFARRF
ncbi:MAG: PilX N-terminal domain-containing pilus assembly protein [Pseudomonadota bacterium]